jgi:hypothetical protein
VLMDALLAREKERKPRRTSGRKLPQRLRMGRAAYEFAISRYQSRWRWILRSDCRGTKSHRWTHIHSAQPRLESPVELGAEFIHGLPSEIWKLIPITFYKPILGRE